MSEEMINSFAANVLRLGNEVRDLSISNAVLRQENEELHKDYEALADEHTKLIDRNARLKAEVERLRTAGDAMAADLPPFGSVKDWQAAKEGKPSV
jgi:predicted nuclease with TOPRIM domain